MKWTKAPPSILNSLLPSREEEGRGHQTHYREQHPPGVSQEWGAPQQLPEPFSANFPEEALEVL